jgi:hypothetical protein
MSPLSLLGYAAIAAIEVSYLPQLARLHRLKHADDVSFFFPALNFAGRAMALAYSTASGEPVFTVGFTVGLAVRGAFLLQVLWYRRVRHWARAAVK